MSAEQSAPSSETMVDELVAYLDGELDQDTSRQVERRLSKDANFRDQLQQLQRSWDLLDELPSCDVDESFTESTIALVAVQASDDIQEAETAKEQHDRRSLGAFGVCAALVLLAGFVATRWIAGRENRQLLQDLSVIENVDEYRYADSLEFLQMLEREGLFAEEEMPDDL